MEPRLTLRAPAKLNLCLEVLGRRADGFHNLRSVMVPIDLFDDIELERATGGPHFECSDPALTGENLVMRALEALEVPDRNLHVQLHKRIPVGAGMGGGSSDAAAILLAAIDGRLGALPEKDYVHIARALGSDVPFFLARTAAIVEGTGERVTALGNVPPWHATIVKPPVAVATAQAYAALDMREAHSRPRSESVTLRLGEALQRADFDAAVALLSNDFQEPVTRAHPQVQIALDALRAWSPVPAILTGSGACVFTLWKDQPPPGELRLPDGFERMDASFYASGDWRSEP